MLIRIGTRQSPLALWQAEHVSASLRALGHDVALVKITTSGDVSSAPLERSGGTGLFTKEIQRALLDGRCDLAVHSLKDLPTEPIDEIVLAAVPQREDPADCLIHPQHVRLIDLPRCARIGTGSPRRRAQLLHQRPDLQVLDIRGNVETRVRKMEMGEFDAILLAYAGLHRLGLQSRISEKLSPQQMLPAVGQAALGLETRREDTATTEAVTMLTHLESYLAVHAERALLRSMRAGCLAPLAAYATIQDGEMHLIGKVFSRDGSHLIACDVRETIDRTQDPTTLARQSESVGNRGAEALLQQGADRLIDAARE